MPAVRQDLETLVRIPSVSLDAFDQQHVEDSAAAVAELLRSRASTSRSSARAVGRR